MESPSFFPALSETGRPRKNFLLLSLWVFILLTFSTQIHAQDHIVIDVKTSVSGKVDLAPVEIGTTVCLSQSDWADVSEVGEDYSLWLKNYERIKRGKDTEAELSVELRTPAFLWSGECRQGQHTFL